MSSNIDFLKLINDSVLNDNRKIYADVEQLKQVVNVLLHFKYMLVFIRKNFPAELDFKLKGIAPEFEPDFEYCFDQYNQLAESCIFFELIQKKEEFYEINTNYCSFKRQYLLFNSVNDANLGGEPSSSVGGDLLHHHHQHQSDLHHGSGGNPIANLKQMPDSIVDTIITEQNHELSLGPSHHTQQQQHNLNDEFSSNETSESSSFNHTSSMMITENQQQQQQRFNLGQLQNNNSTIIEMQSGGMNLVDESNKALYVNLLDLLPKSSGKNNKDLLCDEQPSTSGQKRVRPNSSYKTTSAPSSGKYAKTMDSAESIKKQQQQLQQQQQQSMMESAMVDEDSESMHVENDLLQVEYWCSFEGCRFKSKSLTQVKAHEERRHVKQIVKCAQDGCGSFFDTKDDLNSHMSDIHSGPLFRCALDICAKEFNSDYRLKQHIRAEHKEEYLTCKVCTKKFKTRKYLTRHFRNVHPKEKITDEIETTLSNLDTKSTSMKCTIDNCDKKFIKRSKLKQHIKEEHKEEYLTCNFCDKVCKTRNNLTNHIWIMHEEGDFKCTFDECDFSSKFRKNLLNHKKLRHQRVRKCPMNDCGEMIPITRYQRHMSSLHKIKNYACSWPDCGKSFADHNALKNHVRIHLNFKRYKCKWPECGYASEQRFTVITHIRVCHFKLPRTKKKQIELNISADALQNPYDYLEVCREDICI